MPGDLPAIAVYAGIVASLRARRWQAGGRRVASPPDIARPQPRRTGRSGEAGGEERQK
ncbi:MAG: hypothetical protein JRF30_13425 [Deltaproteobacteria bacterium]|nr:hypothetical protein [Deltaproteobacteria bacterium]